MALGALSQSSLPERLAGASYDPAKLRILYGAYDGVWRRIADDVGERPEAIRAAQLKLANVILALAERGIWRVATLRQAALDIMFEQPTEL
jgi:hypothetical protein